MEIVFRNPFYLWALVVVPVIIVAHFLSLKYSKERAIKFANFVALARVSEKVRLNSNFIVLFLRVIVSIFPTNEFDIYTIIIKYCKSLNYLIKYFRFY